MYGPAERDNDVVKTLMHFLAASLMKARFWWGLMNSARHVTKRMLNPRFLSQTASYEVASTSG
jgi:hypothetical protein